MHKIKSHKTVEQIAKKHRLDISFVKNQLEMGIPIEHEHTKDKDLATDIALQHLDEIPDYYTRLKKMEADAKKHHKKFKDVKEETKSGDEGLRDWFGKSKSSDGKPGWVQLGGKFAGKPCARQPGQTSTPKCGSSKMKRELSKDEEESARRRKNRLDPDQPEKTGGAKPTNVRTEEMDLQEVKDKPSKGSGKKDSCYNKVKSRYSVWPSAYASGALVKCRKVGAKNWGTKSEEREMIRYCPKCQKNETRSECTYGPRYWDLYSVPAKLGKKYTPNTPHPGNFPESYVHEDQEYSMARSEISKIIDASKRLKKKLGKGEGNIEAWVQSKITKAADYIDTAADYMDSGEHKVDESITIEDSNGNSFAEIIDIIGPNQMQPIVDEGCWKGYKQVGMKEKSGKTVPNCVPSKSKKTFEEFMIEAKTPAWQRKEGQRESGGLSQKGVESYRRENPGSKLQTAVTTKPSKLKPGSKSAKRRKSFCARMSGMKKKLTSAKTARDPDSRINKSLRAWNC